jgi:glycine C-acetyltransferase
MTTRKTTSPIFDRFQAFEQQVQRGKEQGLYFYMRKLESASGPRITVRGKKMLMFGSNNYLGLTTHPKVKEAALKAIEKYGVGAGSVRLLGGTFDLHEELEERLAKFKGTEAAIAYSSGYVSNMATLSSFLNRDKDFALVDEKIHASLVDGLRFGQIPFRTFMHNDMSDLEQKLKTMQGKGNLVLIIDGVYSMDGDIANLPAVHRLAQKYGAVLLMDDAHATGVLGKFGRGTSEHFNLHGKVDVVLGTLSKGLGGIGGFAAGPKGLISYLKHCARAFVFSAALPPATCAGLIAAMQVIKTEPQWLEQLNKNSNLMRRGLQRLGFDTADSQTAIIPVMVGDDLIAYQLTRALHAGGIYVSPVTFPAVKKGTARLRVSVMATHTADDIAQALDVFKMAKKQVLSPAAKGTQKVLLAR